MSPTFSEAYDEHVWDVYAFIAYRVRLRADAEDLTQQTFERALRAWHRYDPERASVKTWLLVIARNIVIDHHRVAPDRAPEAIGTTVSEDALGTTELGADLGLEPATAAALGALSDRDREVVALRFGGDLTGPEIAQMLGLTLANVQQILSRSLRRMRAILEEEDVPATS